jgi:APA family basic amino acid/polyamine antiporter
VDVTKGPAVSLGARETDEAPSLFLRKATGLVRGWSLRDTIIYACLSTNIVTLGLYEFSYASAVPKGQLLTSVLISGVWVSFLVITYAGLIVTIPRAGGDYVWQSRILNGPLGFVTSATGWWFILWLWAPIYGNILG